MTLPGGMATEGTCLWDRLPPDMAPVSLRRLGMGHSSTVPLRGDHHASRSSREWGEMALCRTESLCLCEDAMAGMANRQAGATFCCNGPGVPFDTEWRHSTDCWIKQA